MNKTENIELIRITNIKKSYSTRGNRGRTIKAVDGVSFSINRGETLGLVGESGCGKSTLGRVILRLTQPDSGSIVFDGSDITRVSMKRYRTRMQIIFQDPYNSLDPRYRVIDSIAEGLRGSRTGLTSAERREKTESLLGDVGLSADLRFRYPHELSGGQQQRVGIARAIAVDPEFIVCDEPVSSLDVSFQSQIINLLERLQENRGLTYLFISHDLAVVRHISDRIGVMYLGKLVEIGKSEEVISQAHHPYTKALLDAIPIPDPKISRERLLNLPVISEDTELYHSGCRYCGQCPNQMRICSEKEPELKEISHGHWSACNLN